jgi:hypothetical protein
MESELNSEIEVKKPRSRGRPTGRFESQKNAVLLLVEAYSRNNKRVWIGNARLSKLIGCSIRQVQRYISALVKENRLYRGVKRLYKGAGKFRSHRMLHIRAIGCKWGYPFDIELASIGDKITGWFSKKERLAALEASIPRPNVEEICGPTQKSLDERLPAHTQEDMDAIALAERLERLGLCGATI